MKKFFQNLIPVLKETATEWSADNAMRMAAALAYYTVFSLAPLLLAAISISGLVFGKEAAAGQLYHELRAAAGPSVAAAVQEMVGAAGKPSAGIMGTLLAFGLALFGASGVFGELKESLNLIWGATSAVQGGILTWIRGRFFSIGMVMGVCFLLMVSMVFSAGLTVAATSGFAFLNKMPLLVQIIQQLVSLAGITFLFSAMFKYLPSIHIPWKDVRVGGFFTAILFTLGKLGLEQYVARAAPTSSFGAASALALLLVWVYYSAQIFLFGAEFTEVWSRRHGTRSNLPGTTKEEAAAASTLTDLPDEPGAETSVPAAPPPGGQDAPQPVPAGRAFLAAGLTLAYIGTRYLMLRRTESRGRRRWK